eukprot:GEMP01120166.1.p1 GENE.GEMP01120166.1~~GEMP01120166.1.p1  ORF type:complete len:129 (-),score=6.84 GEMP01120166.1:24-410(-)
MVPPHDGTHIGQGFDTSLSIAKNVCAGTLITAKKRAMQLFGRGRTNGVPHFRKPGAIVRRPVLLGIQRRRHVLAVRHPRHLFQHPKGILRDATLPFFEFVNVSIYTVYMCGAGPGAWLIYSIYIINFL